MPQVQVLVTLEFSENFDEKIHVNMFGKPIHDDRTLEQIACDEVEARFGFAEYEGISKYDFSFVSAVSVKEE